MSQSSFSVAMLSGAASLPLRIATQRRGKRQQTSNAIKPPTKMLSSSAANETR
jgi:hypothetical protein